MKKSSHKSRDAVLPTRQKRSAATRDAILKVVERLVEAGEFETATVQDIVRQAGSSVGAFYGRFADKSAVLFSFYDNRCRDLEERASTALECRGECSLWAILSRFVELTVRHTLDNEPFLRVSQKHFKDHSENPFTERARQLNSLLYARLNRLLTERRHEHKHPEPQTAALFLLALVGGLTRDALLTGQHISNRELYVDAFLGELRRAVSGYLGTEP
jgi:AcrR family transcriptional regulator